MRGITPRAVWARAASVNQCLGFLRKTPIVEKYGLRAAVHALFRSGHHRSFYFSHTFALPEPERPRSYFHMKAPIFKVTGLALLAAGFSLQLTSCVSVDREASTSTKDPRATYTPPPAGSRTRINGKTVLNTVRAAHAFSDPNSNDNFMLQLRGERVLTSQVHLIVTNNMGDTIRHEVMPARALLAHADARMARSASVRDQEIAILQDMNTFFAPTRFTQPAVPAGTEQPAEMDTKTWATLREDPAAVGFDYTGADGGERRMAYSRKLGRAIVISQ